MSLEIDFTPYAEHFRKLKKSRAKIKVFGKKYTLNELRAKAKAIAEPKNPVNDKKLPQKKGFSTNVVFGKTEKGAFCKEYMIQILTLCCGLFLTWYLLHGLLRIAQWSDWSRICWPLTCWKLLSVSLSPKRKRNSFVLTPALLFLALTYPRTTFRHF